MPHYLGDTDRLREEAMATGPKYPDYGGDGRTAYERAFDRLIAREVEAGTIGQVTDAGREYLYRPGKIVMRNGDVDRVRRVLRELFGLGDGVTDEQLTPGVTQLVFPEADGARVPDVMSRLRDPETWGREPEPWVQPNHVTIGYPRLQGHPEQPPRPPQHPVSPPDASRATAGIGVTVGVCDTGIWEPAHTEHEEWFAGRYDIEQGDVDTLTDPGGVSTADDELALQAGHGTFVAGVLRETAPGVRLDPEVALDPTGVGDEGRLAQALAGLEPGVEIINLSLGCVTLDNTPSLPIWDVLQRVCRGTVVVAAAGNAGTTRPRWPAAFAGVVGVASVEYDPSSGAISPDPDSSRGAWVDACAPGSWTSTFVRGRLPADLGGTTFDEPYATWSGTSFAAPVVAGRISEIITQYGVSPRNAADRLLDRPRWHPDYGVLVL